jgi:hypothetical protein
MKLLPCLVASAALLTGVAWAQGNLNSAGAATSTLRSELTVKQVVVLDNGTESLRAATEVKPNDLLQYAATYVNSGSSPVQRLVASLPIPPGTQWIESSAVPRAVLASTDGKVFLPVPLMRRVKDANGHVNEVPVPLTEYRVLRWAEQVVASGASYTVSARVRVSGLTTATALNSSTSTASTAITKAQ